MDAKRKEKLGKTSAQIVGLTNCPSSGTGSTQLVHVYTHTGLHHTHTLTCTPPPPPPHTHTLTHMPPHTHACTHPPIHTHTHAHTYPLTLTTHPHLTGIFALSEEAMMNHLIGLCGLTEADSGIHVTSQVQCIAHTVWCRGGSGPTEVVVAVAAGVKGHYK